MTDKEMMARMFQLQEELNIQIKGLHWRELRLPWHRAIWTECAELVESLNWKWWKNGEINMMNVHIELVDIWHFGMACLLQRNLGDHNVYYPTFGMRPLDNIYKKDKILENIEDFVSKILDLRLDFDFDHFFYICFLLDLPLDKLYKLYIGKQVLNRFRNDNGYNDGTYIKIWDKREDNVYMYEFVMHKSDITEDDIYEHLKYWYRLALNV